MAETPTITISGTAYRVVTQLADTPTHRSFRVENEGRLYFLKVFRQEAGEAFAKQQAALATVKANTGLLLPIETGEYNDERFVLREWVEGETFDDYVRRFKFNPKHIDEALAIGEQLARAVAALHEQGTAHGRLKSENVFIDKDDDPVVTDPQGTGDPRDDVRQIGLLLCRQYTRKQTLAINSHTLMELSKAKVPMNLLKVLWQAIQEEPSQRFKDAGTLATALKEVPLKDHEKTVHVRALPHAHGIKDGADPKLKWGLAAALVAAVSASVYYSFESERVSSPGILNTTQVPEIVGEAILRDEGDSSTPPLLATLPWGAVEFMMPPSPVVAIDDTQGEPAFQTEGHWHSTFSDPEAIGGLFSANRANSPEEDLGGSAIWTWQNKNAGPHLIFAHHKGSSYRAPSITYALSAEGGRRVIQRSQRLNSVRWEWLGLGSFNLPEGMISLSIEEWAPRGGGRVVADAIQIQPLLTDRIDTSFLPPHFSTSGTWIKEDSTWTTAARAGGGAVFRFPENEKVSGTLYAYFQPSRNGSRNAVFRLTQGDSERVVHTNQRTVDDGHSMGMVRLGNVDLSKGDLAINLSSEDVPPDAVQTISGLRIIDSRDIETLTMSSAGLETQGNWNRSTINRGAVNEEFWVEGGTDAWVRWAVDIPEDGLYEFDTTTRTGTNRTTVATFSITQGEKTSEVLIDQRSDSGSQIRQATLGVFHLQEGRVFVMLDAARSAQDGVVIAQSITVTRFHLPLEELDDDALPGEG